MLIDKLEAAIASVDRLDWRIAQEPDGEWVAWFHPDWQADPVRVVLADEESSANEVAAIAALQMVVEHAPALLRVARAAREVTRTDNEYGYDSRLFELAMEELEAAVYELGATRDGGEA